ncbi:TadE-like protein [Methylobacterium sp. 174MFSha1.1]|uniref:TadE/TadG family type IV pilus assembly protein n=1 Tax=Methylobacterium sp. 174MFSha1.1 TaxID=1502749 RepID=UPI0008E12DE6|nr:TadE/TadG family type IV pilus assembly protein [Methylobacterium sp. 174MFSha1.1]SFU49429.1 TadE-like protein [Methylobacterium sp. 174MFSha1.1]
MRLPSSCVAAAGRSPGAWRRFARGRSGSFAVEFALVLPVIAAVLSGATALALGFWRQNLLEQVTGEVARCIAIGAPICTGDDGDCGSADRGVCYVIQVAAIRGLPDLVPPRVTIDRAMKRGTASVTAVTVSYPFSMFWVSVSLSASGSFPNQS